MHETVQADGVQWLRSLVRRDAQ